MMGLKISDCEREKSAEKEGALASRRAARRFPSRGRSTQAAFAESVDLIITTTVQYSTVIDAYTRASRVTTDPTGFDSGFVFTQSFA